MNLYIIPSWYPKNSDDIGYCFFREQVHALADRGHNVTVIHITPVSCTQIFREPMCQRREWQDGNVRTIFYKIIIPIPSKLSKIQNWYISRKFTHIIGEQIKKDIQQGHQVPDIIHAHVSHSCGYYCLMASKKFKLPLVVTEHYSGLLLGTASKEDYERVKSTILEANAFIFVGSNFQKSVCNGLKIQKKTYVIPNMIDKSLFPVNLKNKDKTKLYINNHKYEKNYDCFIFLCACHLKEHKGVANVIKSFHIAFTNYKNIRLIIAGDGKERNTLEQLTKDLGETSRISFIGKYKRNDVSKIFEKADAFVLVSKVEPFGVVYIEALMCGLPCIGTIGQGAEDIIDDSNGIKVQYGD